jgi:tRNA threonylcarbamoyladenosine biosynthesis protein TsaB
MTLSAFSFQPSALVLALDTATDRPTLALGTPGDPGPNAVILHRHDLSGEIDRVARSLFASRGVAPSALAGILVADGPGSFTGLRIGIAFAKGLTRALAVPLLAAPSLLGAARAVSGGGVVVADYGALRGDVYRAIYRFDAAGVTVLASPTLVPVASAPAVEGAFFTATGADASAAALLGLLGLPGGPAALRDPALWEPFYGRPAEAEARLLARNGPA